MSWYTVERAFARVRRDVAAELFAPGIERAFFVVRRRALTLRRSAVHSYREAAGWLAVAGPEGAMFSRGWEHQAEEALVAGELASLCIEWDAVLDIHRRFYGPEGAMGRPGDGPTGAVLALEDVRWLRTVEGLMAQRSRKVFDTLAAELAVYDLTPEERVRYLAAGLKHDPGLAGLEAERARLIARAKALKIGPGSHFGRPPTDAEWSGRRIRPGGGGRLDRLQRWELVGDHAAALYGLVAPRVLAERRPHRDAGPARPAFNRYAAGLVARVLNLYYGPMFARPLRAQDVFARLQKRGVRGAPQASR